MMIKMMTMMRMIMMISTPTMTMTMTLRNILAHTLYNICWCAIGVGIKCP